MSIHRWSPSWSGKPSESNDDFVIFEHYHRFIILGYFFFVNFQAAKREIDLNVLLCLWSPWWLSFNICRVCQRQFKWPFSNHWILYEMGEFVWHIQRFTLLHFNLTKCWEVTEFILLFVKCWAMCGRAQAAQRAEYWERSARTTLTMIRRRCGTFVRRIDVFAVNLVNTLNNFLCTV